jgi:hypothetical protein
MKRWLGIMPDRAREDARKGPVTKIVQDYLWNKQASRPSLSRRQP